MCEIMNEIRNDGYKIGIQQGRQEQTKNIAESLLKEGLTLEFVAKCCNLPLEEVEKLKEEIEN